MPKLKGSQGDTIRQHHDNNHVYHKQLTVQLTVIYFNIILRTMQHFLKEKFEYELGPNIFFSKHDEHN